MNGDDHTPPDHGGDDASGHAHTRGVASTDASLMEAARRGTDQLATASIDGLDDLWDDIARAAFGDVDEDSATEDDDAMDARTLRAVPSDPAPDRPTPAARRRGPPLVRSMERRQRRAVASALVGVAAAVLAVVGVSWVLTNEPAPQPVATFRMEPLDDRVATGVEGRLVTTDAGQAVEVDLDGLPAAPDGTFYELWLLDLDAGRLVSLGPVDPSSTYSVPSAVAAASWPTIDVSVEPVDGDPTHSSDSVLRGPVVAAPPTG